MDPELEQEPIEDDLTVIYHKAGLDAVYEAGRIDGAGDVSTPPNAHWWVLEGGFIAQGGKKYSGPYLVENDVFVARATLERVLGHNSLFIDQEPRSGSAVQATQDRPAGVEE